MIRIKDDLDTVAHLIEAACLATHGLGDNSNAMNSLMEHIAEKLDDVREAVMSEIDAKSECATA
ncbi:hypothetical protein CU048_13725 [Beijerinckiaceae bacterium]|nr:hypothetical protein CU048_13725 [Beijerinckiaceae bacterium]